MNRESRTWRRLAIGGAASTVVLVLRLFVSPQRALFWWLHPELVKLKQRLSGQPVDDVVDGLLDEAWEQQMERRLAAVEQQLQELPPERRM